MKLYEHSKKTIVRITKMTYEKYNTRFIDVDHLNNVLKNLGVEVSTVLEANFVWTVIQDNLSSLIDGTLNDENIKIPKLKKFEFTLIEQVSQNIDYSYNYDDIELFSANKSHLKEICRSEDYEDSDPYWNRGSDDSDYGDSDTYDFEVRNIKTKSEG